MTNVKQGDNNIMAILQGCNLVCGEMKGNVLGFDAVTYTGNGTSQDIVTNIASVDFTVASNGSGYYLDRTTFEVKNDAGTVQASGTCICNVSKVHIKNRASATWNNVADGLRGVNKTIYTNETSIESSATGIVEAFNSDGFTVGDDTGVNANGSDHIAYQTLYTHIKWGTTNQGKKYVEAYNPTTKETMIMYEGSGTAGHEIPQSLGVALGYWDIKNLTTVNDWRSQRRVNYVLKLNLDGVEVASTAQAVENTSTELTLGGTSDGSNSGSDTYILYGKAKSITWTIVEYVGTGAGGNFVECGGMPRRVILKATSAVGDWVVFDSERETTDAFDGRIELSSSGAETTNWAPAQIDRNSTGFTIGGSDTEMNIDGVSYIALVEFDTNADGGGSYFYKPTGNCP